MRRLVIFFLVIPLLGALTAPAAAQSQTTTEELLLGMVTKEVEPGVYRVIDDAVRDLTVPPVTTDPARHGNVVAGLDGSVWLFLPDRFFRLGDEDQVAPGWQLFWPDADIEITPDGSVWAIARREDGSAVLVNFSDRLADGAVTWGEPGWPEDRSLSDWADRYYLDITAEREGNVLAAWHHMLPSGTPDRTKIVVERDIGGWVALWPSLTVDPEDHAWWLGSTGDESADGLWLVQQHGAIYRSGSSGSSEWRLEDCPFEPDRCGVRLFDVGLDGTVWMQTDGTPGQTEEEHSLGTDDGCGLLLARFDGTDWKVWGPEDVPPAVGPVRLWGGCQEGVHVAAPDGSVWLAPPGYLFESSLLDGECTGIANFDGTTWRHYLDGVCVYDASVAPDGAVWLQGGRPYGLYVITPEAVAAAG